MLPGMSVRTTLATTPAAALPTLAWCRSALVARQRGTAQRWLHASVGALSVGAPASGVLRWRYHAGGVLRWDTCVRHSAWCTTLAWSQRGLGKLLCTCTTYVVDSHTETRFERRTYTNRTPNPWTRLAPACGRSSEDRGSASSKTIDTIQRYRWPRVHIPFPGRTCIRLFSSDVLALSL